MSKSSLSIRILKWALRIFIFLLIPMLMIYFGLKQIENLRHQNQLKILEQKLESALPSFEACADTEAFLARTFREAFYNAINNDSCKVFATYHQRLNKKFDYILWNGNGKILANTLKSVRLEGNERLAWQTISELFSKKKEQCNEEESANLRRIFGPQIAITAITDCRSPDNIRLLRNDSIGERPLAWICSAKGLTAIIFVKQEVLHEKIGLKYYVCHKQPDKKRFKLGFIQNGKPTTISALPDEHEALQILQRCNLLNRQNFESQHAIYFSRLIEDNLTVFAWAEKTKVLATNDSYGAISAITIFLFMLPWVYISLKSAVNGMPLQLSISCKLGLLFVYSNGLPLIMLFFVGYDFINQKQFSLFDEIHERGTLLLQNLDERLESEHAMQIIKLEKAIEKLKSFTDGKSLTPSIYGKFVTELCRGDKEDVGMRIYLVASEANLFGTEESLYIDDQRHIISKEKARTIGQKKADEIMVINKLGKFILSGVNGKVSDSRSSTEVELIAESAVQKPLVEVRHDFLAANGKITDWGLGTNKSPSYTKLIAGKDSKEYDYLLITNWGIDTLEEAYLRRHFLSANRNINELQICLSNEENNLFFPTETANRVELRAYVNNFTRKPCESRQFIEINNREYLIMGFRGKYLENFVLFALYPVDAVKKKVFHEQKILVTAGILSVLLTLLLGRLLSHSFLFPLQKLAMGAEAIRKRDFALRLPELGRDEFGEIAHIFNETMVDLEELKIAGVVQEHLLPHELPQCSRCSIYGKIVSTGDLGGGYFDYFNTSPGRFSAMVGNASGKGAAAALIMAIVKAGIMQSPEQLEKPADLALRIHELIMAASKDVQKAMAFQYINIAEEDGIANLCLAGGNPALLINSETGSAKTIETSDYMLGVPEASEFSSYQLKLSAGEAIILYSDGAAEAQSNTGDRSGLATLQKLAIKAYDPDPAIYCEKLLKAHPDFTGQKPLEQNMTILIITFNKALSANTV
ncbi:MAG: HAMP domain-containing protein [Erysipelotrichia bacterium]|nr:HAMP domain-containing protein [Erysipelotrichia bacterium]